MTKTKTAYEQKENKKFTNSWKLEDYEILTPDGWVDVEYLHETIPYDVYELKLENGYSLKCADDHLISVTSTLGVNYDVFVKDLKERNYVITDGKLSKVISVENLGYTEKMYDFQLKANSNRRYYTNGILSHNTELAKQLTKYMFESEDSLIRLDMSEYMEKISASRISGAAPGYVGYDEGSDLLNKVRTKPYSVILLDEIEKAHPDIYNIFLQVFDDGYMTDSHGRKVSFKNCVILMTSNVGTKEIRDFGAGVGFTTKTQEDRKSDNVKDKLEKELKKKFPPEFINRIDDIIYFKDLGKPEIMSIIELELLKINSRVNNIGFGLSLSDSLKEHLVEVGYDPQYGARPMKRAIQRWVDDYLTDFIMENSPVEGSTLLLDYNKDSDTTTVIAEAPEIVTEKKKSKKQGK